MPEIAATHNQFAYSVSEISTALKRVVEDTFGQVRVRGEISGWKVATSGHAYLKLKDEGAVLDAVCWKGVIGKMPFRPEDGIEVICTGRITTYPGRSNYQIVIDFMEPAGAGALMALLEKRKKELAAEGLFDENRKKPLPFMPKVIGIVTSPTGAVIRDILHRLSDRFGCHVLVWPVPVQGEGAAEKIAAAIEGFNNIGNEPVAAAAPVPAAHFSAADLFSAPVVPKSPVTANKIPKPDLIIVARGGGSLEDLWAFNEEIVVRAAANSRIPLISAVGHETDTTLIDYASDRRAPTPTAAAEMAVPVRQELILAVRDLHTRVINALVRGIQSRSDLLAGLMRGLPHPKRSLELAAQKLDDWHERLRATLPALVAQKSQQLAVASAKLQPRSMMQGLVRHESDIALLLERAQRSMLRLLEDKSVKVTTQGQMLQSLDYKRVLARGYAMVRDAKGALVSDAAKIGPGQPLALVLRDGSRNVKAD